MDFVGDEDAIRYALEMAFREHVQQRGALPLDALPSASVSRAFRAELESRGWVLHKKHIAEEIG